VNGETKKSRTLCGPSRSRGGILFGFRLVLFLIVVLVFTPFVYYFNATEGFSGVCDMSETRCSGL
jgi:hypothetical protein